MSKLYMPSKKNIELDWDAKEVNMLLYSDDGGNVYAYLTFGQIEELAEKIKARKLKTDYSYSAMEKTKIDKMVDRFLSWPLPKDFAPDGGVSFMPLNNPSCWPIGTNLLHAGQAREMIEYILADTE